MKVNCKELHDLTMIYHNSSSNGGSKTISCFNNSSVYDL